jgi:hypothetical protein
MVGLPNRDSRPVPIVMSLEMRFVYDLCERGPFMLNLHNWGVRKLGRTLGTEIRRNTS